MDKKDYTEVRLSHLMGYAGIGSIIKDKNGFLVTIPDTDQWLESTCEIVENTDRIRQALGIDKELRFPPKLREDQRKNKDNMLYIKSFIFPKYAVCSKCRLLYFHPWNFKDKDISELKNLKCSSDGCSGTLKQVHWCVVNEKGYLSDIPWHDICHLNSNNGCKKEYDKNYLEICNDLVRCRKCGATSSFKKVKNFPPSLVQPWLNETPKSSDNSKNRGEILEINSSRIYIPYKVSALVIPPESRINKNSLVYKLYKNKELRDKLSEKGPRERKFYIQENNISEEELDKALEMIDNGYPNYDKTFTDDNLLRCEFKAFLTQYDDMREDEEFVIYNQTDKFKELEKSIENKKLKALLKIVKNLIVVKRLREIQIFKGFFRLSSEKKDNLYKIGKKSNWLPAIELFGEGIFFNLDDEILSKWENLSVIKSRISEIKEILRMQDIHFNIEPEISARFILLHTLAHLFIKELEISAGYPAASLKERIYCDKKGKMAGILIYVCVADKVGSLGGIIKNAKPRNFLSLLNNAFNRAKWCSLDPVCSEQKMGPSGLNKAACHNCSLIPETSCQFGNVLLDRILLKGNDTIPDFLEFILEDMNNG